MIKLEELIAELCPNGVEYKKLKDVSVMARGTSVTKSTIQTGEIPVISGGQKPAYYCNKFNREGCTITVSGSGANAGYIMYWEIPIFVCDAFSIKGNKEAKTKYLFYCLENIQQEIYATKKGGGVPHVHISSIENFQLPIPPLEIQREIVRVLDNFTELTEELIEKLTEELTARKKQYEYYRNELLCFNNPYIEWTTLGKIGKISMCKRIMKAETSNDGDVPFYKIGTFGGQANAYISRETFEKYKELYSYPKKGDILISAAGTIGRTVVFDGKPAYFQDSNIVWIANDESTVLNSFLRYYYQLKPWQVSTGGTIARLYNDNISKVKVPVLPINEQERIVHILDRFDTLCNDISTGLLAEIEARKKQYEYYRDKLLTFKELS